MTSLLCFLVRATSGVFFQKICISLVSTTYVFMDFGELAFFFVFFFLVGAAGGTGIYGVGRFESLKWPLETPGEGDVLPTPVLF